MQVTKFLNMYLVMLSACHKSGDLGGQSSDLHVVTSTCYVHYSFCRIRGVKVSWLASLQWPCLPNTGSEPDMEAWQQTAVHKPVQSSWGSWCK